MRRFLRLNENRHDISLKRNVVYEKILKCLLYNTTLRNALKKTESDLNFQLNLSKHVGKKCGKRTDGESDGRRVTTLKHDLKTKTCHKIQLNKYVKTCRRKICVKLRISYILSS